MSMADHYDSSHDHEPSGETPFTAEGEIEVIDADGKTRQVWYKLDGRETWTVRDGAEEEWSIELSDAENGNDLAKTHSGKHAAEVPAWLLPAIAEAHAQREDGEFQEWVD
jgi:hypothetical protein